ncbi:hypothetical protein KYG_00802 [Acidovorax sp. NO-1]|uniref:hypothetical protein n=1 Tax=Acidovorax sp. NO-1 TaxID=512030 RepID=UPI00023FCD6C|nr:hypothetical protein [Acidovorax sp. NO-1]EHL24808.1 hypothetical protein KYG_00802 [Acidovorax sp. NO-1]
MISIESVMAEREKALEEFAASEKLIRKYRNKMPAIVPKWDASPASISFNDIHQEIVSSGLSIYNCQMGELWAGLDRPEFYESNTLWSNNIHVRSKIAGVIDAWAQGTALSPIFLVKHGSLDKGLVSDGNHRLTVARAIGASEVPFMVETAKEAWVSRAFPTAVCIHQA